MVGFLRGHHWLFIFCGCQQFVRASYVSCPQAIAYFDHCTRNESDRCVNDLRIASLVGCKSNHRPTIRNEQKQTTTDPPFCVSSVLLVVYLPQVVVLTLGMFFVWSVIGLQLWGGVMESRCYYPPTRQYDIPLVRCTSAAMPLVGIGANCNVNSQLPSSWTCTPVTKDDVFTIGSLDTTSSLHSTTKYTELKASHEFPLNRSTGLADIPYNSSSTEECRVVCSGCRTGSKIWYV